MDWKAVGGTGGDSLDGTRSVDGADGYHSNLQQLRRLRPTTWPPPARTSMRSSPTPASSCRGSTAGIATRKWPRPRRAASEPLKANEVILRLQAANPLPGTRYVSMGFALVNIAEGVPFLATVFADLVRTMSRDAHLDFPSAARPRHCSRDRPPSARHQSPRR